MTSQKQLEANRSNAQRSTGPKSENGKKRSRANAMTHGLTAKKIIFPGETPEQFERLREGLIADFGLVTTLEFELVDHLAALLLRRRRPPVLEAALLRQLITPRLKETVGTLTIEEIEQLMKISKRMLDGQVLDLSEIAERQPEEGEREAGVPRRVEMLNVFARYEAHITNEIVKTVKLLLALQERRMTVSPEVQTRSTH